MQKTSALSMLLCTAFSSANLHAADDVNTKYLEESRKTAQEFMQKLGGVLKQQLDTAGPESAIDVCRKVAPALAAEYSQNGRVVKRVSLKPRNKTLGTPDAWETRMLQGFEQSLSEGNPISGMETSAATDGPDGRWFRYMKAIPTQTMCLQCHGQPYQIPDNVKALLAKNYPEDQAVGYSAGELRGAVSIKMKRD